MRRHKYPSDVTDEQWALIEPLIPVYPGGRPRKTDLRDVVDAVLYVLRTGCQWRYLPKDFPPRSTAWRYFDEWRHNGTLDAGRTHQPFSRFAAPASVSARNSGSRAAVLRLRAMLSFRGCRLSRANASFRSRAKLSA